MIRIDSDAEKPFIIKAAEQLCVAARTAPKGKGVDLLMTGSGLQTCKLYLR